MADEFDPLSVSDVGMTYRNNDSNYFLELLKLVDKPANMVRGAIVETINKGSALDGMMKGLFHKEQYDIEQTYSDEFRKENPNLSYWSSAAANLVADPLTLTGLGLFNRAGKGMDAARKAGATIEPSIKDAVTRDGSILSNYANYIPDFYSGNLPKKVKGGLIWLGHGTKNLIKQNLDTEARALQAEKGINKAMLESSLLSPKGNANYELVARAMYNADILSQQGKKVPQELERVLERTFMTSNTPLSSKETYGQLINRIMKEGGASTKNSFGQDLSKWSEADLNRIGKHLYEGPWTSSRLRGKGKALTPAQDKGLTLLNIKRPQGLGGNHITDLKGGVIAMTDIAEAFGKYGIGQGAKGKRATFNSVKEMEKAFNKIAKEKGWASRDRGEVSFKADKDGIWLQTSQPLGSIREGGANVVIKVKPDGDFLAVMNDEHNFMEKLGGDVLVKNRMISATPPMTGNIRKFKQKAVAKHQTRGHYGDVKKGQQELREYWNENLPDQFDLNFGTKYLTDEGAKQLPQTFNKQQGKYVFKDNAGAYTKMLSDVKPSQANVDMLRAYRQGKYGGTGAGLFGATPDMFSED